MRNSAPGIYLSQCLQGELSISIFFHVVIIHQKTAGFEDQMQKCRLEGWKVLNYGRFKVGGRTPPTRTEFVR